MKRNFTILVMAVMVLSILLAACGSGNSTGNSGQSNSQKNNSEHSDNSSSNAIGVETGGADQADYHIPDGTTITFVNGGGNSLEKQMDMYGDLLEAKFPNVNFVFKGTTSDLKIDKMILGGEKFDIFIRSIGSFFYEVPENGFQYDMTELIEQHQVDVSGIDPVLMDSMTSNAGGAIWGIPFYNSTLILYYNKDLFDSFGVDYPTDDMTWDEVFQVASNFNQVKDGVQYVGLAISDHHLTKLNHFGLSYVDPTTNLSTYDDDRWKHILDVFYTPTQDPGYQDFMAQNENKIADSKVFYAGQAAMFAALIHHTGNENFKNADFDWDMAAIPTFKENSGVGGQAYPEYAAIASFSENKDAAMEVIKYMISEEFQMEFSKNGNMPVLTSKDVQEVFGTGEYANKNSVAVFYNPFATVMTKSIYDSDVEKAFTKHRHDLALNKLDMNTMLRMAKEEADLKIAEKSGN